MKTTTRLLAALMAAVIFATSVCVVSVSAKAESEALDLSRDKEPVYTNYIDLQKTGAIVNIRWGLLGITAKNGCSWISVYNVLKSQSSKINSRIAIEEMTRAGMPFALGLLGSTPWAMTGYLMQKFRKVNLTLFCTPIWPQLAEGKDALIVIYQHEGITSTFHCVACIPKGDGKFMYVNEKRVAIGRYRTLENFIDFLREDGCKFFAMITVKDKKGDW